MLFMLHPVSRAKRGGKRRSKRLSRIHMATNLIPPAPRQRKPVWIRVKAPIGAAFDPTRSLMRRLKLASVCEEGACPKLREAWPNKHAKVLTQGAARTGSASCCDSERELPSTVVWPKPPTLDEHAPELWCAHIVIKSMD